MNQAEAVGNEHNPINWCLGSGKKSRGWAKLATVPATGRWFSFHNKTLNDAGVRTGAGEIFAAMVFLTFRGRSVHTGTKTKAGYGSCKMKPLPAHKKGGGSKVTYDA